MYRTSKNRYKNFQPLDAIEESGLPDAAVVRLNGSPVVKPIKDTRMPSAVPPRVDWSEVRRHFILGKRTQLDDGSWISEDWTQRELADLFGISRTAVGQKMRAENWKALRRAYLARVDELNVGNELGIYATSNFLTEVATMNACNRLGVITDAFIQSKFGDILDLAENIDMQVSDTDREEIASKVDISELKEAIKVVGDIYKLQRTIYENAPVEKETPQTDNRPRMTNKEREAKIRQLEAKLGRTIGIASEN